MISNEEWVANYKECMDLHKKQLSGELKKKKFTSRETAGGFNGIYMSWGDVWLWAKQKYPNIKFFVKEINEGWIVGELWLGDEILGSTVLTLMQYVKHKETPEQLVNRVLVKLIAQYLGYGLHLWVEKGLKI